MEWLFSGWPSRVTNMTEFVGCVLNPSMKRDMQRIGLWLSLLHYDNDGMP